MAELLCTRLCHDLTGPIGAVNNGAEFLSEEGFSLQSQAVGLIVNSAAEAVHRLQFYRAAYGRINSSGEACLADKKRLAADFFRGSKITLDWPDSHTDAAGVTLSHKMSRLVFNLLIIAASTLLKGGTIAIRLAREGDEGRSVRVTASGPALKWEEEIASFINNKPSIDEVTPRNVQLYLTANLVEELGASLTFSASDGALEITALQTTPMLASA